MRIFNLRANKPSGFVWMFGIFNRPFKESVPPELPLFWLSNNNTKKLCSTPRRAKVHLSLKRSITNPLIKIVFFIRRSYIMVLSASAWGSRRKCRKWFIIWLERCKFAVRNGDLTQSICTGTWWVVVTQPMATCSSSRFTWMHLNKFKLGITVRGLWRKQKLISGHKSWSKQQMLGFAVIFPLFIRGSVMVCI